MHQITVGGTDQMKFSIRYGRTIQTKQYESSHIELEAEGDTEFDTYESLRRQVVEKVKEWEIQERVDKK